MRPFQQTNILETLKSFFLQKTVLSRLMLINIVIWLICLFISVFTWLFNISDISFVTKTDHLTYSTDMCLLDRLQNIYNQDQDKYKYVVANILLAKQVLKEAKVYKPYRSDSSQGGLGGVGIENWILQHGVSFIDAARSFVEAANGKTWDEFKETYKIWDFGENHLAVKRGEFPHDNFVYNNMSKEGYIKMTDALKKYIKQYEQEETKGRRR